MEDLTAETSERAANIIRDYFGIFRACSGRIALFCSQVAFERCRPLARQTLKFKGRNGRSGEI